MNTPTLRVRWDLVEVMREQRGLVEDHKFVAAMGISHASYSRVTSGKQTPGIRFIAALCTALETPIGALVEVVEEAVVAA